MIFAVSGILLALFLTLKQLEINRGQFLVLSSARIKADERMNRVERMMKHELPLVSTYLMRLVTAATLRAMLNSLRAGFLFISSRLHRFILLIEGRVDLSKKGSASFYLRSVAEHKKSLEKPSISR